VVSVAGGRIRSVSINSCTASLQLLRRLARGPVAIDDAIRTAASPQVVILGAGLDGRAWRVSELADAIVFEVDHPDSQRMKRERAARTVIYRKSQTDF
jgi:Leucine carboxyl methyltransferase